MRAEGVQSCLGAAEGQAYQNLPLLLHNLFFIIWWEICCVQQKVFLAGGKAGWFMQKVEGKCSAFHWAVVLGRGLCKLNEVLYFSIRKRLQGTDNSERAREVFHTINSHSDDMPPALYYITWRGACSCHITWNVDFGETLSRSHTSLFNNWQL